MDKIRVLHIVGYMNRGGQETLLMNIFRKIDKAKFEFSFVVQTKDKCDYDDEIYEFGGHIYHLPAIYRNPISRFLKLRKIVKDKKYHVVHRHSDKSIEWIDILAAKLGGANVRIYHSHSTSVRFFLYKWLHLLCRPVNNKLATHKFACSSQAGRWMFGDRAYNAGEITIVPNAIDVDKFKFDNEVREFVRGSLNLHDKFVIGHIGRFDYQKNHKFLVEVFAQILKQRSDAMLMLVGDGEVMPDIKRQVAELGLDMSVLFLGVRSDVHELYQAMDVFVLPSLFEGLGIVGIEAQAAGLPCVVSDRVPNEAIVCDGCVRIRLEEDVQKWVDTVLRSNRNANAFALVRQAGFDIRDMVKNLSKVYSSI